MTRPLCVITTLVLLTAAVRRGTPAGAVSPLEVRNSAPRRFHA